MFVCPLCYSECYVDEDGDIIQCSGCNYTEGMVAIYVDDSIINF